MVNRWHLVEVTGHKDIQAGSPKTVFIMVNREIYASTDNGASWEARGMQTNLPWEYERTQTYLRGISVHPADPKKVFLGFGDFTPGTLGGVAQSTDFGKSWTLLSLPVEPNSTIWTFGVNAAAPEVIFAATRYGYLYRSDDSGISWIKLKRELSEIAAVCVAPN